MRSTTDSRNIALLPGPTAGQWDLRGKIVAIAGSFALVISFLIVTGLAGPVKSTIAMVAAICCLACIAVGFALVGVGLSKKYAELRAGYSTVSDEPGVDLRHPRTGAIIRASSDPVAVRGAKRVYDGMTSPVVGPNHPSSASGTASNSASDGASTTGRPAAEG